jgi:hypothetical protein
MKRNPPNLPSSELTPFAQAYPDCYKGIDAIEGYRKYYAMKTTYMNLKWDYSPQPYWWNEDFVNESVQMYNEAQEQIAA